MFALSLIDRVKTDLTTTHGRFSGRRIPVNQTIRVRSNSNTLNMCGQVDVRPCF